MPDIKEDEISHSRLLLDPNNNRFHDIPDFVYAHEARFHEGSVQERALRRLRADASLLLLKNSILKNGYIPLERIIVRPYAPVDGMFVVVEGNRRLAAIRWIVSDYEAGVEVPETLREAFEKLAVVVIGGDQRADKVFEASLMGIRHVSGIKAWGGYQRAKLVVSLRDDYEVEAAEIADRLAMSVTEVNRRYRAFKALQQMQTSDAYADHATPDKYPLFHEAVSLPIVRDWLGWSDERHVFSKLDQLERFYDLLAPGENDEGTPGPSKISTYLQVRELRDILAKPEAKRILLDSSRTFQDALNVAKREEVSRTWAADIAAAVGALESMGVGELKALSEENRSLLERLRNLVDERLSDWQELRRDDARQGVP